MKEQLEGMKLCLGTDDKPAEFKGLGLESRTSVTLWCMSATDHLIRKKKQIRPPSESWKNLTFAGIGPHGGFNHPDIY